MQRILLACLCLLSLVALCGQAFAQDIAPEPSAIAPATLQPSADAEPLVVLIEYDPWSMVIGSDAPRLALYDDGVVIYRKEAEFVAARLTPAEVAKFRLSLHTEALTRLAGHYSTSQWTDQPTTDILVRTGTIYARISVYGRIDSAAGRSALSPEIPRAFDRLTAFQRSDAVPWLPETIEVMVWPYEHARDESIVWPDAWPGLEDAATRRRGDSFSLYMPVTNYPDLNAFLRTRRERGAVLIDGRKWSVQPRPPFPKEERWDPAPEDGALGPASGG